MTQYYNVSLQKLNNHAPMTVKRMVQCITPTVSPHFCITTERRLDDHIAGVVYSMI